jgi:NADPH:quinone reductase-like Zn-dependent oxidoreductase
MSKQEGEIISIQGHLSAENIRGVLPDLNSFLVFIVSIEYWIFKFRLYLKGVRFDSVLQKPGPNGIRSIAKWVDEGKLKPVVGKTVKLEDIDAVREVCTQIASGKGGLGKTVVVVS